MLRKRPLHPSIVIALAFAGFISTATLVLMLPISRVEPGGADWLTALFTATSAVCVTGLVLVDTGSYWSTFGQVALLVMFQVGGFGLMTTATLMGVWLGRSMSLQARLQLQSETRAMSLGDARQVVRLVLITTFAVEAIAAAVLAWRFATAYATPWREALWLGVFHSISAFNNAGFAVWPDSVMRFVSDGWILTPLMAAVVIGGLGFPVVSELWSRRSRARRRRSRLSLHATVTLGGTALLLLVGTLGIAWSEWSNPKTLGAMDLASRWWAAAFTSVVARTAGFNAIDLSAMATESYVLHYGLMYVGAGNAGTGGGVKVATVAVLLLTVWNEMRDSPEVVVAGRRIPVPILRQALTLMVLSAGAIALAMVIIVPMTSERYEFVLFEVISAFATVGASAGITAKLPPAAQLVLISLMFAGRVGLLTLALALGARQRRSPIRYPEEKLLVG